MSRRFYRVLAFIILFLIFSNSMLNAEISSTQSGFIVHLAQSILGWVNLDFEFDTLSLLIRKLAHFLEFFALGFTLSKGWSLKFYYGVLILLGVAVTDETIQFFSEGRALSFIDMTIDLFGGLVGILIAYVSLKQSKKKED